MISLLKILQNAFFLSSASLAGAVLNLIYAVFLTRYLGANGYGVYSTIFTMLFFAQVLMNFGMQVIISQGVARDKQLAPRYFGNALVLMTVFSVFAWGILVVAAFVLKYPAVVVLLTCVAGGSLLFAAVENSSMAVMLGFERMVLPSIWVSVFAAANVGVGVLLLRNGLGLNWVIFVYLATSLGRAFALFWLARGMVGKLALSPSSSFCWAILRDSFPVAVLRTLQMINERVDITMLSLMVSFEAVGFYSAAARLIALLAVLPRGISGALVPHFASLTMSQNSLRTTYLVMARFCAMIAFPVAILVFVFADKITLILFGKEYLDGQTPAALRIMAPAFLFLVVSGPVGPLLINSKEKIVRFIMPASAITLANIVLNLILIPKYSFLGAALSTTFCALLELVVKVKLVSEMFDEKLMFWRGLLQPWGGVLLMSITLYLTRGWFFPVSAVVSCCVYVLGVALTSRPVWRRLADYVGGHGRRPDNAA